MVKTGRIFRYPAGFLFYTDKMLTGCCDRIQKNSRKDDSDVRKTARKKQQQALENACGMERNMKICPKCKGNVADGLNVCTHCGAVITPQAAKPKKKDSTEVKRDNQAIAITSVIITLVGIFIMFEVSALVGMIIYLIAFALSFNELRKDSEFRPETIVPFAKKCLSKENFKGMGLMFLVVAILPLMAVIGSYRWIVTDTYREVESMYNDYY